VIVEESKALREIIGKVSALMNNGKEQKIKSINLFDIIQMKVTSAIGRVISKKGK